MVAGIIIVLGILIVALCIVWIRDINRFVVISYDVLSSKLKKDATVVMLSDLHNKEFGKNNEVLIQEIKKQKPDMIWVAGDMFTSNGEVKLSVSVDLLKQLSAIARVYYANGNHEQKIKRNREIYGDLFKEYKSQIKNENLCMLENERVFLPEYNMNIAGLEIEKKYFKRMKKVCMDAEYIKGLLGEGRADEFQVLLSHNPEYFENYVKWGADLTLSGHVHGGVMRLPVLGGVISPSYHLFPKYDGGLFEENGRQMILGRGLGTHTIPLRIFNPGELVVIHLKSGESKEEK